MCAVPCQCFQHPALAGYPLNPNDRGQIVTIHIQRATKAGSIIAVACLLTACATTVTKDGATTPEMQRDIAECQYEAKKASPDNPLIAHGIAQDCFKLRGYGLR